jgi:hypothetical protein
VLEDRHNSEDGVTTASSKVDLKDDKDVVDQTQVWNSAGPFHDHVGPTYELHPRSFEEKILDTMPALGLSQVEFEQLALTLLACYVLTISATVSSAWTPSGCRRFKKA